MICDKNVIYPLAWSHSKEHHGGCSKCWQVFFFFFFPIATTAVAVIIAYVSVSGVVEQRRGPYSWERPLVRGFLGGDGPWFHIRVHLKLQNHSLNFWRVMPRKRTSCASRYIGPSGSQFLLILYIMWPVKSFCCRFCKTVLLLWPFFILSLNGVSWIDQWTLPPSKKINKQTNKHPEDF